MEQFEIIEDGVCRHPYTRQEILTANAYDLPILKLIVELLEKKPPCKAVHSEPRGRESRLKTGRVDDYNYVIIRRDV